MIFKKNAKTGMTLIELIIVLVIAGILALTTGILMVRSFESWRRSVDRITTENEVRYFRRKLEYQFRSATTHPAAIIAGSPNDTLRFATYFNNYNLSNQYTQNEYKVVGSTLVRDFWNATAAASVLNPAAPWGGAGSQREVILSNVVSLKFEWAGLEPQTATSAVKVHILQSKPLPSGGVYISSNSFTIKSRNRG